MQKVNKVYVTEAGGELAKDNLFKDAEVEENEFVLTYYINGDGKILQLKSAFLSSQTRRVINVPEKIWRMVIGKLVQMELLPK